MATKNDFNNDRSPAKGSLIWVRSFAADQVLVGDEALPYLQNCEGIERHIIAVVRIANETQLIQALNLACREKTPVHVIGQGKNWGYGSSLPITTHSVVFDLSPMNGIRNFDSELGLVTIEPGVTQGALFQYLAESGHHEFMVPITGAGPTASVLANALERGFGINPNSDHYSAVMSLRAVLANGQIYESRLQAMGAHLSDPIYKWKVGPYLEGLFAQSCLGVVTQVTISLAVRPGKTDLMALSSSGAEAIPNLVEAIRSLRRAFPDLIHVINLSNSARIQATIGPPSGLRSRLTNEPITSTEQKEERRTWVDRLVGYEVGPGWTAVVPVPSNLATRSATLRGLSRICRKSEVNTKLITGARIRFAKWLSKKLPDGPWSGILKRLIALEDIMGLLQGIPTPSALKMAYFKNSENYPKSKAPNPGRDGCGLYWYAPILPLKANILRDFVNSTENILLEYDQLPALTIINFDLKLCEATIPIYFKHGDAVDRDRARACWTALYEHGIKLGYAPYRYSIDHMARTQVEGSVSLEIARAIRDFADPKKILMPGRYL